ncbi:MAG: hypothetical protein LBU58_10415 [Clostridiales bacterium]|nr:hypothetical protein [Clostridiales bacterium]
MTIDVIKDIKQAESEADQVVRQAQSDARAIISDAKSQAEVIRNESAAEGRRQAEEKLVLAEKRADAAIEKLRSQISNDCAQIAKKARAKFADAANIISGRIVKFNVDR